MKPNYDVFEQLRSARDISTIMCEVRTGVTNDYFRYKYEECVSSILYRSTETLDTISAGFLLRLVQLIDAIFPETKQHEEQVLRCLQLLAYVTHIPRLAQVSRLSRVVIDKHHPEEQIFGFSFNALLRVYRKTYLNGLDLLKANSSLAMQADGFYNSLRNGALFGQYLFGQCQCNLNVLLCKLMVRKVLLKCVQESCADFLNGFYFYVFNEIIQIYKFYKDTIREYLQAVFDEYFDIMDKCVYFSVSTQVVTAISDLFLLYKDQVIADRVQKICAAEYRTIIAFTICVRGKLPAYYVALIFKVVLAQIASIPKLPIALLALFPCEEASEALFPAIFTQFDAQKQYRGLFEQITGQNTAAQLHAYLSHKYWIIDDAETSEASVLFKVFMDEYIAYIQIRTEKTLALRPEWCYHTDPSDGELRHFIDKATAYQMVYVVYFLIKSNYNYWEAIRLSENQLFQAALLYFYEHFRKQ